MTSLLRDERGVASVEYVIVLVTAALGVTLAILGLGAALLQLFDFQQALLLSPIP